MKGNGSMTRPGQSRSRPRRRGDGRLRGQRVRVKWISKAEADKALAAWDDLYYLLRWFELHSKRYTEVGNTVSPRFTIRDILTRVGGVAKLHRVIRLVQKTAQTYRQFIEEGED